jgi:hypothetical protein
MKLLYSSKIVISSNFQNTKNEGLYKIILPGILYEYETWPLTLREEHINI